MPKLKLTYFDFHGGLADLSAEVHRGGGGGTAWRRSSIGCRQMAPYLHKAQRIDFSRAPFC